MKTSRRHRWITLHGPPPWSLCRDCGLESTISDVRNGQLGSCLGKASGAVRDLGLPAQGIHNLGAISGGDYILACVGCGTSWGLGMLPHRNPGTGKITGWVFGCERCIPAMGNFGVMFVPEPEEGETDDEQREPGEPEAGSGSEG